MAFNPPGGSGGIAGATDVTLDSPQDNEVLTYDSSSAKWQNSLDGSVMATSATTRPTANPDVTVIFKGNDPGSNALNGDIWLGEV